MSKCVVGASLDSGEEEAGNEEESPENGEAKKPNTYKIYGTIRNPDEFKPVDYVKETIDVRFFLYFMLLLLFM